MLSRALSRSCKVVLTNIWASKAFLVMPSAAVGAASGACVAFSSAVARSYHSSSSNSTLASFTLRTYSSSSDVSDEGNDSPPRVSSTASTEDRKTLEAVSHIIERVTELSAGGSDTDARHVLEEEILRFTEQHGSGSLGLAVLQGHLSTLAFYDADYDVALSAAEKQHAIWAEQFGEKSAETALNDLRLGIALLGKGKAAQAFPLIEAAGAVASQVASMGVQCMSDGNFARHIEQHEALVKAAEESEKGSGPAPPAETIMMVETLVRQEGCPSIGALARDAQPLSKFGRTVCEARLFRSLSALWAAGPGLEANWSDKGEGAVMFLCSEQTEGLQRLLMFLGGEHELLRAFLREHRRLMEHARLQGLQHVAAALRNHQKVLQETLATGGAQA